MEWISVKDKLPEDIYTISYYDEFYAVVTYMPLKLCELNGDKVFLIDDSVRKMALAQRKKGMKRYVWATGDFDRINDECVLAWIPLPEIYKG